MDLGCDRGMGNGTTETARKGREVEGSSELAILHFSFYAGKQPNLHRASIPTHKTPTTFPSPYCTPGVWRAKTYAHGAPGCRDVGLISERERDTCIPNSRQHRESPASFIYPTPTVPPRPPGPGDQTGYEGGSPVVRTPDLVGWGKIWILKISCASGCVSRGCSGKV